MVRGFKSFHPIVLLVYYIFLIAGLMLYQHPVFLFVAGCFVTLINLLLDGGKQIKKWGLMIFIMCIFSIILTPLFNQRGNQILFYVFNNQVMLEGIIQGVMIAFTLFGIIAIFITFNMVITPEKFLFLFSKWFPQWALLIMLSMRFVPLLRRRLKEIQEVQQLKGVSVKNGNIKQRAKNGMLIIQILLTWSLEESIQTGDSMTARGYGFGKRSKYQPFYMRKRDLVALGYIVCTGLTVLFGWWLGDGVLTLLPILEPVWLQGREWFYLAVWLLFIGFPIWTEGKERLKWRYFRRTT
ncbi:energy-coupling factor transporter transmembrane component T [Salinibacillus xinjiangensis]|uniref:Energy-coupling factor transporter transmembrane protein EcfT n=1 Tax=Salinibacillus xinjiangensis TaxID=1229268 RepID=A0A6G1X4L2_9BACI|nr:energy-coupling factor transporter transmembrane component T [Salinibacillus xinjiangensis]MRG85768.1 energy-coupling factor transporter transmembrane protein EcfT [Salinibacillus xinjiangensis]